MEDRIELILKTLNLSPAQFADEIGIQRSGIYHIIKGRNKPGMDFLTKILDRYPDINAEWLLTGKGPLRKQERISMVEEPTINSSADRFDQSRKNTQVEYSPKSPVKKFNSPKVKANKEDKEIVRILIFYKDGTFSEHLPQ